MTDSVWEEFGIVYPGGGRDEAEDGAYEVGSIWAADLAVAVR